MLTQSQLDKIRRLERHLGHLSRLIRARHERQSGALVIDISIARLRCGVN